MKLARLLPFLCAFLALSSAGALANTPPTVSASPNPATTDQNTDVAITCIATDTEDTRYWGFYFEGVPDFGIITDLQRPPCTVADGIKTCTAIVTYRPNPNYEGPDNFDFKFDDGLVDSATATANINVVNLLGDTAYVVTKTADTNDGVCDADCSLREAITAANADRGPETISFNITGAGCDAGGVCTIAPTSALPTITSAVVIDGYTQPGASANTLAVGNNAVLKIQLQGQGGRDGSTALNITGGYTTVRGLAINQFGGGIGIQLSGVHATGNIIAGNYIGTDVTGATALPNYIGISVVNGASKNRIGTDGDNTGDAGERNLVSGSYNSGITVQGAGTSGNVIAGNYIGTNAQGTAALKNSFGIFIGAASNRVGTDGNGIGDLAERNLLSGNSVGVLLESAGASGNIIAGNYVGTNAGGTAALGNEVGINIATGANNTRVGGSAAGEGNTLAFNSSLGVLIANNGAGNLILSNSIHSNGAIGIELRTNFGQEGVNPNDTGDGDTGANNGQNFPVISSATATGGSITIAGSLNTNPNAALRVEFFSNAACDASGNGEGRTYLGFQNVTTDEFGNAAINATFAARNAPGEVVTATASNSATKDTSEFSACRAVVIVNAAPTVSAAPNPATMNEDTAVTITLTGTDADDDNLTFSIAEQPTHGTLSAISPADCTAMNTCTAAVTYTPNADYSGPDSFAWRASDGLAESNALTIAITVDDVPEPSPTPGASASPTSSPSPSASPTATVTPAPTATATPIPAATSRQLLNIATRLRVQTGENVLIGGVIVTGSEPKKVLIRAIGPSLAGAFDGALSDTKLELYERDTLLASNEDWKDTQQAEIEATTIPPSNELESAIVYTLHPGSYTAIMSGGNGATGIGVIEVYDLDQAALSRLANIATRGFVQTGEDVMIGGLIVGGSGADAARILIRAIGPSLLASGVTDALRDPMLQLVDAEGNIVRENDNWQSEQQAEIEGTTIPPNDPAEAAILVTLGTGDYTAVVRGKNGGIGVALVEVYNVQ